jgi:type-F conjugative transfer system secretin TraK
MIKPRSFLGAMGLQISLWINSCFALQTYQMIDHHQTQAMISQEQQNRITVSGDRIQQIFGADGMFDIQSDDERGQIFLKALPLQSFKPITITLITEAGLTQDLKLIPKPIEAQSILLKPVRHLVPSPSKEQKVLELMRQLILEHRFLGQHLEGYVKSSPHHMAQIKAKKFTLEPITYFKGSEHGLEGKIYTLVNTSQQPLILSESDLALKGHLAIYLAKRILLPKEKTKLFVVSTIRRGS